MWERVSEWRRTLASGTCSLRDPLPSFLSPALSSPLLSWRLSCRGSPAPLRHRSPNSSLALSSSSLRAPLASGPPTSLRPLLPQDS